KGDRPTETHQHPVDHQTVAPQVCEAAIVPVAWLDVGLELQFGADGGERRQGRVCRGAEGCLVALRRIDADEADLALRLALDAVAVGDAADLATLQYAAGVLRRGGISKDRGECSRPLRALTEKRHDALLLRNGRRRTCAPSRGAVSLRPGIRVAHVRSARRRAV